ncbi:hypothetical protein RBB50_009534 [Rhinocladiella similis]
MAAEAGDGPIAAPTFTIDLDLPPEERYKALAMEYKDRIRSLSTLFDSLLADMGLPSSYHGSVNRLARLLLRRLNSPVETAELRGIAEVVDIPMYLLVAFNTILDLLMGCTSGAIKTLEPGQPRSEAKMLHFRTLDWTMDPLRSVIVQLDFIRSKSASPSQVLASSVSYVGFVGVLTGVRPHLSVSLNFRAVHNADDKRGHFRFYFHHLLVLFGYRRSISSILRSYIVPELNTGGRVKSLVEITDALAPLHTTAAYLILCDGNSAIVIEKDYETGLIRHSDTFIAATNHDELPHRPESVLATPAAKAATDSRSPRAIGLQELLEESRERLDSISAKWRSRVRKTKRQSKRKGDLDSAEAESLTSITQSEVVEWLSTYPTTNEQTHYASILDPKTGQVTWTGVYLTPLSTEQ